MATDVPQVLLAPEAEGCVQALENIDLKEVGSSRWTIQHEYLEKLNMQAVFSASQQEDEYVKEFLITHEKVPLLIHELIVTETWKQRVFPEFVSKDLQPGVLFPMYMVLYHEATCANLLETILYHRETAEAAEDNILDLLDYCYRKLTYLVASTQCEDCSSDEEEDDTRTINTGDTISSLQELVKQKKKLDFDVAIKSVSMIRYMTDHLSHLPLSTMTRMLETLDVPLLLVQLIESPPWTKNNDGTLQKYVDTTWTDVAPEDRFKLTKIEGQVWLAIYQLLMSEDCQRKYELNPTRKNTILKLRSYLTEVMVDQIPMLGSMRHYLEQLSMMDPPQIKRELILEQIPEIQELILKKYEGQWGKIAKKQSRTYFSANNPDIKLQAKSANNPDIKWQAKRLADTYNFDVLESLITDPPKCAVCGEEATKRCSRCQNEWYCRRECQVGHWKKHKSVCDILAESVAKNTQEHKLTDITT